ncbi:MAG: hypothetical protein DID92_2727743527 [Candidatus Nitrotoga sp. SPKER]|nr:MAG: hypothetical protein DID92_2727743527 [Candidatus Nitrotoga sp. SPKER]
MPQGVCRLCKKDVELQLSHIVPAFIYRWMRESSGNGHLRCTQTPNRRVQDGPQKHWLCADCEGRFSRMERSFANQLFHPYLSSSGQRFQYGNWLLQFCTSVSWRVLHYYLSKDHKIAFGPIACAHIAEAEATWRAFLLGYIPHPGSFRQHLIPLDRIESTTAKLPTNINRYLMRTINIDLCRGGDTIFVYSKLGRFLILGFVNEPNQNQWVGSKVNANQGTVEPKQYVCPAQFLSYLINKANSTSTAISSISDKQRSKSDEAFRSNIDRFVGSDLFKAMDADVEMFGSAAFGSHTQEDENKR